MVRFILSQKVEVGIGGKEWVDIRSDDRDVNLMGFARQIIAENPSAILSLRKVEETILVEIFEAQNG